MSEDSKMLHYGALGRGLIPPCKVRFILALTPVYSIAYSKVQICSRGLPEDSLEFLGVYLDFGPKELTQGGFEDLRT
jgi:hypothetical protein